MALGHHSFEQPQIYRISYTFCCALFSCYCIIIFSGYLWSLDRYLYFLQMCHKNCLSSWNLNIDRIFLLYVIQYMHGYVVTYFVVVIPLVLSGCMWFFHSYRSWLLHLFWDMIASGIDKPTYKTTTKHKFSGNTTLWTLHCWSFLRGIHWSLVYSPHKGLVMRNINVVFYASLTNLLNKVQLLLIWNDLMLMWQYCNVTILLIRYWKFTIIISVMAIMIDHSTWDQRLL